GNKIEVEKIDDEGLEEMGGLFEEVLGDSCFLAYHRRDKNSSFVIKDKELEAFNIGSDKSTIFMGDVSGEILYLSSEGIYVFKDESLDFLCGTPIIHKIYAVHLVENELKGIISSGCRFYYGTFRSGPNLKEMSTKKSPTELFGEKYVSKDFVVDAMIARPRQVYQLPNHLLSVSGSPKSGVVHDLYSDHREFSGGPVLYDVDEDSLTSLIRRPEHLKSLRLVLKKGDAEIRICDKGCGFYGNDVSKTYSYDAFSVFENILIEDEVSEHE
ncbi:MAG: hypothetical protein GOU99_03345, partial [Candidatus Altiarchaeota archaeon]|nr:hypothetical protein [Candidatus Altiarchaeota archaeon]